MKNKMWCVFLLWVWVMVLTLAFFGLAEDFLKVQAVKVVESDCAVRK